MALEKQIFDEEKTDIEEYVTVVNIEGELIIAL
jgi:hypothetical protein